MAIVLPTEDEIYTELCEHYRNKFMCLPNSTTRRWLRFYANYHVDKMSTLLQALEMANLTWVSTAYQQRTPNPRLNHENKN